MGKRSSLTTEFTTFFVSRSGACTLTCVSFGDITARAEAGVNLRLRWCSDRNMEQIRGGSRSARMSGVISHISLRKCS